jgi:hypothetical protein
MAVVEDGVCWTSEVMSTIVQIDYCLNTTVLPIYPMRISSKKLKKMSLETATYHPIGVYLLDRRNPSQMLSHFGSSDELPCVCRLSVLQ